MKIFSHFTLGLLAAIFSAAWVQAFPRTSLVFESGRQSPTISQPDEEVLKCHQRTPEMPEQSAFIHLVQPGETVASLSKLYRVEQERIRRANFLEKQDALDPGLRLIIPD